jgi:predicted GNAT family acetyltransferase
MMEIKDCKGLKFLRTQGQKTHMIDLLNISFKTTEGDDILSSMENSHQYYILHKHRIASILSLKETALSRTGNYIPFMIYNACTHPRFQNRGFMSNLLAHVVKTLVTDRPGYLFLEVLKNNTSAIGLYHKMGFRAYKDFGEGVLMRKRIPSRRFYTEEVLYPPQRSHR